MRRLLPLLTLALGACGYTDPGTGSHTLLVQADSRFSVGDTDAVVTVDVAKGGTPVLNANVGVKDGETGEQYTIAYQADHQQFARYRASIPGYHRRLELAIVSGSDQLAAKLEGPGPHSITQPAPGVVTRSGDMLGVEWATGDGIAADEVVITVQGDGGTHEERVLTQDTGSSHDIAFALLPADGYELTVRRLNRVAPAGGVGGSTFEVSYGISSPFNLN